MIRILVADHHVVVRRGVIHILQELPDIVVTREAASRLEVLQAVRQADFDVVVLELAIPPGDGLETLAQLQQIKPDLPVLVFSVYPEKQYAVRALRAGAAGYLSKASAAEELVAAVRTVAAGGIFLTSALATKLAAMVRGAEVPEPHEGLSDREFQVMHMIAEGKTLTAIATELSLSVKTISTYRSRILDKLGVGNSAEIIRYVIEHDLLR